MATARPLALAGPGRTGAVRVRCSCIFYPIISGWPLPYLQAYNYWMWLPSWR